MSDPTNQEYITVASHSCPVSTPRLNSTQTSLPSIERAVRHEVEHYRCRKIAREDIGRISKIFHDMNGGEFERKHRLVQSQLLDEFDMFQQDAEITVSRDSLEQVNWADDNA